MNAEQVLPASLRQRLFRQRAEDALPHAIEHKRIYILPARRGWAFLLTLLVMLIASINYSLSLGYALCFLLTGLFWATLLHTYRNLAGLCIDQVHSTPVFCGTSLSFTLRLRNPGTLVRHGIRLSTEAASMTTGSLPAGEPYSVEFKVPTRERGWLPLGRLTLSSDYPLGLWKTWCYLHVPETALVYPTAETEPPPLPGRADQAEGELQRTGNQGDVSGLRDYVPGDSLTSVAWKSAARGLGLHVRTFDAEPQGSRLYLNLNSCGRTDEEEQLSRLTAWVLRAEELQLDYTLDIPGTYLPAGHGNTQREAALSAMAVHGRTAK